MSDLAIDKRTVQKADPRAESHGSPAPQDEFHKAPQSLPAVVDKITTVSCLVSTRNRVEKVFKKGLRESWDAMLNRIADEKQIECVGNDLRN